MTTFSMPPAPVAKASGLKRLTSSPALIVFALCLFAGAAIVGWRASRQADTARATALLRLRSSAAGVESRVGQAISAGDVLLAITRVAGGPPSDFQRVATEIRSTRTAIASIEFQPGGVTREIVPRPGNQSQIGFNVLTHPAHSASAQTAARHRGLTVAGPLPMASGAQALVVRVPVFPKARDGRESFWGFISVNVLGQSLAESMGAADLGRSGYNYALYVASTGRDRVATFALRGRPALATSVQQSVRAGNLELRLALEPEHGWFRWSTVLLEFAAALAVALLVAFLVYLAVSRAATEVALTDAQRRLDRELSDRARSQDDQRKNSEVYAALQTELKRAQARLKEYESEAGQVVKLEDQVRLAEQGRATVISQMHSVQTALADTQQRLKAAELELEKAGSGKQEELEAALATNEKLQSQIEDLQQRLDISARAAVEFAASTQAQTQEYRATIADLKTRWESYTQEVSTNEAAAARQLSELEAELKKRNRRVAELEKEAEKSARLLEETREEINTIRSAAQNAAMYDVGPAPDLTEDLPEPAAPAPGLEPEAQVIELAVPGIPPAEPLLTEVESASERNEPSDRIEEMEQVNAAPEMVAAVAALPAATATPAKPAKFKRAKKEKRDNQMDLFAAAAAQSPAINSEAAAVAEPNTEASLEPPQQEDDSNDTQLVVAEPGLTEAVDIEPVLEPAPDPTQEPEPEPDEEPGAEETDSAAEPAAPDFPDIQGVAVKEGLAWFDNQPREYLKALQQFIEQQADAPDRIRDALEQGDVDEASRCTQTLKTAAADIAAVALHHAVSALAQGLNNRADPTELESLWDTVESKLAELLAELRRVLKPKTDRPAHPRHPASSAPVNVGQLRKAAGLILPLLADGDPGAKDCLKDNRATFQTAFSSETFADFEQSVKKGRFADALEALRKVAKKHGVPL